MVKQLQNLVMKVKDIKEKLLVKGIKKVEISELRWDLYTLSLNKSTKELIGESLFGMLEREEEKVLKAFSTPKKQLTLVNKLLKNDLLKHVIKSCELSVKLIEEKTLVELNKIKYEESKNKTIKTEKKSLFGSMGIKVTKYKQVGEEIVKVSENEVIKEEKKEVEKCEITDFVEVKDVNLDELQGDLASIGAMFSNSDIVIEEEEEVKPVEESKTPATDFFKAVFKNVKTEVKHGEVIDIMDLKGSQTPVVGSKKKKKIVETIEVEEVQESMESQINSIYELSDIGDYEAARTLLGSLKIYNDELADIREYIDTAEEEAEDMVKVEEVEEVEEIENNEARKKELRGIIFDMKNDIKTLDDVDAYIGAKRELADLENYSSEKKIEITKLKTRLMQEVMVNAVMVKEEKKEKKKVSEEMETIYGLATKENAEIMLGVAKENYPMKKSEIRKVKGGYRVFIEKEESKPVVKPVVKEEEKDMSKIYDSHKIVKKLEEEAMRLKFEDRNNFIDRCNTYLNEFGNFYSFDIEKLVMFASNMNEVYNVNDLCYLQANTLGGKFKVKSYREAWGIYWNKKGKANYPKVQISIYKDYISCFKNESLESGGTVVGLVEYSEKNLNKIKEAVKGAKTLWIENFAESKSEVLEELTCGFKTKVVKDNFHVISSPIATGTEKVMQAVNGHVKNVETLKDLKKNKEITQKEYENMLSEESQNPGQKVDYKKLVTEEREAYKKSQEVSTKNLKETLRTHEEIRKEMKSIGKGTTEESVRAYYELVNESIDASDISDDKKENRKRLMKNNMETEINARNTIKDLKEKAKIEITGSTKLVKACTDRYYDSNKIMEERDLLTLKGTEEVKNARVFKGENGEMFIIYEESKEITDLRSEAKELLKSYDYGKDKEKEKVEYLNDAVNYYEALVKLQTADRRHKEAKDNEVYLTKYRKELKVWSNFEKVCPRPDKLKKAFFIDHLNVGRSEKKYFLYEAKDYKKDTLIEMYANKIVDTPDARLECEMKKYTKVVKKVVKKVEPVVSPIVNVIDHEPNKADEYLKSIGEEVKPIEKIKKQLIKKEKKIIKFVPTEEIKKMDFSADLEGIGNLFNAM